MDLRIGEVEIPRRLSGVEGKLLHVADNADDFDGPRRTVAVVDQQPRADRVEALEPAIRQRFVDDRHRRRSIRITLGKRPAAREWDTYGLEVPGGRDAELGERHALPFDRPPFHRKW